MKSSLSIYMGRAAAPGRPKQGSTPGHEGAASWPSEGRAPYSASGVLS